MPQTMVETSYCLDLDVLEGMSQVPRRLEVCNSALSTPGYLLALLRELSLVPQAPTEVVEPKQVRRMN